MWPHNSEDRLHEWHQLRVAASEMPLEDCLLAVNDWWFRAPITSRYLHWDDAEKWPTPWELLHDNIFCDLARSLGMLYTLAMIQHAEITELSIIETDRDNLVQVNDGKYILNWAPQQLVNIDSIKQETRARNRISSEQFEDVIR